MAAEDSQDLAGEEIPQKQASSHGAQEDFAFAGFKWLCLKIVYPYTQWLMIIIPTKWL